MVVSENNAYFRRRRKRLCPASGLPAGPHTCPAPRRPAGAGPGTVSGVPVLAGACRGTLSLGTTDWVWQAEVDETRRGVTNYPALPRCMKPPGTASSGSPSPPTTATLRHTFPAITCTSARLTAVDKIPFFAVIPGRATGMAWDSNGTLYISGTEGLAAVDVWAYYGGSGTEAGSQRPLPRPSPWPASLSGHPQRRPSDQQLAIARVPRGWAKAKGHPRRRLEPKVRRERGLSSVERAVAPAQASPPHPRPSIRVLRCTPADSRSISTTCCWLPLPTVHVARLESPQAAGFRPRSARYPAAAAAAPDRLAYRPAPST